MSKNMEIGVAPYRTASCSQVAKDDWVDRGPMARATIPEHCNSPCPLKIAEVNSLGHFVRIVNSSPHQAVEISGYILWQLEGGHAVSMYRFPQNLILPAHQHVTVWASAPKVSHNPPTDLLWKGRVYFRSNPQCITVLSRPNGQPVASHQTEESPMYTSVRKSASQNQKIRRWPVLDQHQYSCNLPSPAILPRRHSVSAMPYLDSRAPQNMSNPANAVQQLSPAFRNPALTNSRPASMCVTWHPSRLNTDSPLVRLVAQKTARSRRGFKFLSHIPFTFDVLRV
ncbi:lamin tail domain-containing protein 2 [Aquarana catesbeiana]|uniref:lamin tail domain-containing protein 2 n=1 Tax=Aquarana catesbeiana TaxID=8400 RepID=UPI003CC95CE1